MHSFARIAINGAETKLNDHVEGARHSPPFALHFFREMAILVLKMGYEEGKKVGDLVNEVGSLKNYISVASEKWKLACKKHLSPKCPRH